VQDRHSQAADELLSSGGQVLLTPLHASSGQGHLHVAQYVSHLVMPSVNIRQLRDTKRLKSWLRAGKIVELRERNQVIARIVPQQAPVAQGNWPDFEALAKEIIGDRVLSGADLLIEERGRY